MNINVAIELPANEWEEAEAKVALKPIYDQLVTALNSAGVKFQPSLDTATTRAKTAPTGAKRGRKPKGQPAPTFPTSPPPDEDEAA